MKWKCPNCGHEQPAHPATTRDEMSLCSQPVTDRGIALIGISGYYSRTAHGTPIHSGSFATYDRHRQYLSAGACGGLPEKVI